MANNTVPTPITDKNGKNTTVHKKTSTAPKAGRLSGIAAPVNVEPLKLDRFYVHNDEFSGTDKNVPVVQAGGDIAPNDAVNWHEASEIEIKTHEAYWDSIADQDESGVDTQSDDARAVAQVAANAVLSAAQEEALSIVTAQIGKNVRIGSGETATIARVASAEVLDVYSHDGLASVRVTVVNQGGDEFEFLTNKHMPGITTLDTDVRTKETDRFVPTSSHIGTYLGYPFEASSVADIAFAATGEYTYPDTKYPILTGHGVSIDLATGSSGHRFEFGDVNGGKTEYVVPEERESELENFTIQPARKNWTSYDPDALR